MLSLRDSFGQGIVIRETWGWMHYSFYVAFVGLFIGTTIVLINSDVRDLLRPVRPRFLFLLRRLLSLLQSRDGHLLPAADPRRADGRCAARVSQTHPAERSARRKDARQSREPARLRVPDDDDGAGRRHRPDARGRADQRRASRVPRMGIRGTRRGANRGRRSAPAPRTIDGCGWCTCCACSRCCFVFRSPSCVI